MGGNWGRLMEGGGGGGLETVALACCGVWIRERERVCVCVCGELKSGVLLAADPYEAQSVCSVISSSPLVCRPGSDGSEPLHIVEVGSGHGRLAFLIARELLASREHWPDIELTRSGRAPFKVVLTDFTDSNADFWQHHECLAPLFAAGVAEWGVFNAEVDKAITLQPSGRVISADTPLANPLVGVANYIFDTLRQDAFRVVEGQLQEGLAAMYSDRSVAAPLRNHIVISRNHLSHTAIIRCHIDFAGRRPIVGILS